MAGTKTDTPLTEIPNSIYVITKQQMVDLQPQNVQEALRYTAGIYTEQRGNYSNGCASAGQQIPDGPMIHGAHLEGPFVSPHKLGAQPPFNIPPTPDKVSEVLATNCVRVVTLAPELPHAQTAMESFAKAGVCVSLGHTVASYEQAHQAIFHICKAGGVTGGTHLFNAMPPIESRRPGPVTALMCSDAYAEMIFDTHHIHPATFQLAQRVMPERLVFVTDAMRAAGLPGCWFIQNIQGTPRCPTCQFLGKFNALRFTTRKSRRLLAQSNVSQTNFLQNG